MGDTYYSGSREFEEITYMSTMKFGKHKGKHLYQVPDEYFLYLHKTGKMGRYRQYIEERLEKFQKAVQQKKGKM